MSQMAYSGMIGQMSPYSGARMAGSTMNAAGSMASPLMMGGLTLAGLDPFSMALRGGAAGYAAGGFGGAAVGALGGAASVGLPLMAMGYAGGQFMEGAQQHQMLRGQLNSNFGFRNQFGGSGFSGHEVGMIGSTMRDMASQLGPAGEQVSFNELGRLAANMGRMGMAEGVRNAKDFTDKFRQMVSSLKQIATEMGTSLEEAQKMMAGMKQAGVFGMSQQVKFAGMIRNGAAAGGMATSELTGMMGVGSQLSRMIGGRGISGARAGLETITNIGVAQQMGVLSEEDIYNATGETGAMGRRVLATQQLQGAAQFLKGGLGRRMLAAMAGRNGQLDQGDVEEFSAGGVSVDRTRQMWQENMRGVGRANFIRNEGRLRGEVLSKFGGLTPAIAMRGWLEGKGIDANVDNDRAMLFMQRRLNMGRDEADVMLKQVRDLPQIMRERGIAGKEEDMSQRLRQRQQTTGIEGIKRKLDHAVATVRGEFQEAGAGFMANLENEFEGLVNHITGTRVQEFRRDVSRAFETGRLGGATGRTAISQTFGIGGGIASNMRRVQGPQSGQSTIAIGQGIMSEALGLSSGSAFMDEFNRVDRGRLAKRGFGFEGLDQGGIGLKLREMQRFSGEAAGRGIDVALGGDTKSRLRDMYSRVQGLGEDRAKSVQAMLLSSGDPEAQAIGRQLSRAGTAAEKGRIIAGLNRALGRPDEGKLYAVGDMMGVYNTSSHLTYKDQASAIGEALLGTTGEHRTLLATGEQNKSIYDFMDRMLTKVGIIDKGKHLFAKDISEEAVAATGAFARTEEGRRLAARAIDADASTRAATATTVQADIAKLQAKEAEGNLGVAEHGQLEYLRSVRAAQRLQDIGGANAGKDAVAKAARDLNMTPEQFMARAAGIVGLVGNAQRDALMQVEGRESREAVSRMSAGGLITQGRGGAQLSVTMAKQFKAGTAAGDFLRAMVGQEDQMSQINEATDLQTRERILTGVFGEGGSVERQQAALRGMSVKDMRGLAESLRGKGAGAVREDLLAGAQMRDRLGRGGRGRGLHNLTGALGSQMSAKDIKKMMSEGGSEQLTGSLMEELGLTDVGSRKDIQAAVGAMQGGDIATAEQRVRAVLGGTEMMEARKKKSLAAAEQSDPLQAKANELLKGLGDKLDEQTKALGLIATNTTKETKDVESNAA
jgi:hypothetical protein